MIHDLDPVAGKSMRDLIYLARCYKEDRRTHLWIADICAHFMTDCEKGDYRPTTLAALAAIRRYARSRISKQEMLEAANNAHGDAYIVMPGYDVPPAPKGAFVIVAVAYWAAEDYGSLPIASAVHIVETILEHIPLEAERTAERQWQFERLVARLSDPEPEDWPAPSR